MLTEAKQDRDARRVGILIVHGIGEQKRFEHLDDETRKIIFALREEASSIPGASVTVEVTSGGSAPFQAEENTWQVGPGATARITLTDFEPGKEVQLYTHEVWWADVNEPYSLAKQIRFWLWGLSVWRYPRKTGSNWAGSRYAAPPIPGDENRARFRARLHLFGVAMVFFVLGLSVGLISFLAKRLLDFQLPALLQTITNYVSGVKLYNQRRRFGKNLLPNDDNFLDNIGAPPRYAIRRRMLRGIADVACNDYDDWFVLAHSLGSVVAFNGLMEPAWNWPGYFDEEGWDRLRRHAPRFAGPHADGWLAPEGTTVPARPSWSATEVAYRSAVFARFRGMLTYGCPLEKFASIWPARVPISRVAAFSTDVTWVNAFDPLDPVSGVLVSFSRQPVGCCPLPVNIGYATSPILLYGHLEYLTGDPAAVDGAAASPDLVTAFARWVTGRRGPPGLPGNVIPSRQFKAADPRFRRRTLAARLSWCVVFVVLAGLCGAFFPVFVHAIWILLVKAADHFAAFFATHQG
jgi:hypothetical protein